MPNIAKDPIFTIPSWVKPYSSINLAVIIICLIAMFQYHFKIDLQAQVKKVKAIQTNFDSVGFINDNATNEYVILALIENSSKNNNAYLIIPFEKKYLIGKIFERTIELSIDNKIVKGKITEMISIFNGKKYLLKIYAEENIKLETKSVCVTLESISFGKMLKEYIFRN